MGRALGWAGVMVALASASTPVRAQALPDNDYAIDLYQGPVLAPIRVTGIAGAYAGYAEGIEGFVTNAAAPAVREPFSFHDVEFDISASFSIPVDLFENNDFDNSGGLDFDYSDFIYANAGGQIRVGWFGTGAIAELQSYNITDLEGVSNNVLVGRYHVLAGVAVLGGQLNLGAGARLLSLGLDAPDANLTMFGAAPEVGMLIRPDWESYRFGATFRMPVTARELLSDVREAGADGVVRAGGLVVPDRVTLPWELELGIAVQVGPRPFNPEWLDPSEQEDQLAENLEQRRASRARRAKAELSRISDPAERARRQQEIALVDTRLRAREADQLRRDFERLEAGRRARYENWPRERILLTADLLMTGAVEDGVSLERFLGQNQRTAPTESVVGTSGGAVNFSPRVGVETEPIPNHVATRFGSYYEPNRFERRVGRQHFTFGADLRVLSTTFWGLVPEVVYKLQASADFAPRYESFSAGIGVWH